MLLVRIPDRSLVIRAVFFCVWFLFFQTLFLTAQAQTDSDAVCAEVKIVIEQKLSLERQAFDAKLLITNGLDDAALKNVAIELYFQDQNQVPVSATSDPNAVGATFFVRNDSMKGLSALDGSAHIEAKTAADIRWLIIPSAGAGGLSSSGKLYYIGAKVTYTLNGETNTVDVTPDYVVVKPQPLLRLDYFLPTDVYADDAFTNEVEPSEPFTLGVRILNKGGGTALKTSIESAQPKIVENKQGLLINFEIIEAYVGNQNAGKSLLLNFGDIAPNTAKVGRWNMLTTLSGRFVEFNANYTHADHLGGAVTSLLSDVVTHKLVHDVWVDLPERDRVRDFLAQDGDALRVYESDGVDHVVIDLSANSTVQNSGSNLTLKMPLTQGLIHSKIADPFQGRRALTQVLRSNGSALPSENFWLSKTRNQDLSWNYFVHVFDTKSTGEYTLIFSEQTQASLGGRSYQDTNNNGLLDIGESALSNAVVILKGQEESGRNIQTQAYTNAQGEFAFSNLNSGRYQLELAPLDGWINGQSLLGSAGGVHGSGFVTDIVLLAGTKAEGYLLSKRRAVNGDSESNEGSGNTQIEVDLSTQLQANPLNLAQGDLTQLTVVARNVGANAVSNAKINLSLPIGLSLTQATATQGSFTNGIWTIGALSKDQQVSLSVSAKADSFSEKTDRVLKAISQITLDDSASIDKIMENNSANVSVIVKAKDVSLDRLTLDQTLPKELRLLVFVACPDAVQSEIAACTQSKAQIAQQFFSTKNIKKIKISSDLADWEKELRSGFYNALWFNGSIQALSELHQEEIRAHAQQNAALVFEGISNTESSWNVVADLTQSHANSVWVIEADLLKGASPAIESETWKTTIEQRLNAFKQASSVVFGSDFVLAGAYLPLLVDVLHVANSRNQDKVNVQTQLPLASILENAEPQPNSIDRQKLNWNLNLSVGQSKQIALGLRMPQISGLAQVQTTASQVVEDVSSASKTSLLSKSGKTSTSKNKVTLFDAKQGESQSNQPLGATETIVQTFQVVNAQTLWTQTIAQIQDLKNTQSSSASSFEVINAQLEQALQSAQKAQNKHQTLLPTDLTSLPVVRSSEYAEVLASLAHVQNLLRQIQQTALSNASENADLLADLPNVSLNVARWLSLAQMNWQAKEISPPVEDSLSLQLVSGNTQSAIIRQAFAQPLKVQIKDQNNQGRANVSVRFELPSSGASAYFVVNNVKQSFAEVLTDNQGFALSPTLKANETVGLYEAIAKVTQIANPLKFALENKAESGGSDGNGGNGGGTSSNNQMFTGQTATGTGNVQAHISGGGANCAFNPQATRLVSAQNVLPTLNKMLLPHGVFEFELINCNPGSQVTITTTWPDLRGITGYLKYGPTPNSPKRKVWYVPKGLKISGNTVTYTVQDGSWGDDDLKADGVIHDPSAPVIEESDDNQSSHNVKPIPTLHPHSLMLLIALMFASFGLRFRRKKSDFLL